MAEWIKNLILACLTFISPVHGMVIGLAVMVIFDLFTGMWAAYKTGLKIESKKMRLSIGKFIAYFMLIIISHVMDTIFIIPVFSGSIFTKLVGFLIASIEFTSVIENFQKILCIPNLKQKIIEFLAQNKK